ncbi:MAG: short-chain dehydrogenase [Dehalococcoidales bacterium]|nr:short-chain dehydrogenase [Dehalococcoidales bacterium]
MGIPSFSLEGKVAIVTGGKRGIGKAIALAFAEAGADVAICSRVIKDGELQATANEIQGLGRRSLAVQADITRKTDVDNLVQRVVDEFTAIDILVNNAGIYFVDPPLLDVPEGDWDKIINVNLKGHYLCSQAVGKRMVDRKAGNIINIASELAIKPSSEAGVYCIAKAGVVMLTRVLAKELASYNIRVNAIAPGAARTKMLEYLLSDSEALKQYEAQIPLGRIAEPGDIIGTALFLASEASSYITGHTILVDGGLVA